ncbi:MAG: zinc ribbon domain-containing protein [Anaerolineae bacterium]|nr:zinc ribbon domain-containing protein [Anaerolineae bacterium]
MAFDLSPRSPSADRAYQMLWDCRFCGTKKLLGVEHRHCPNCGAAQDPQWRYFPSDEDKKEVADPDYVYAGVDRICPFCGQPNSRNANFCKECGGDLSGAQDAAVRAAIEKGSAADTGVAADVVLEKHQAEMARIQGKTGQSAAMPKWLPIALILTLVVCVGLVAAFLFLRNSTYDVQVQVSDVSWERVVAIGQVTTLTGSGWRDSVPPGAYNQSCSPRQREYQVPEQYECGTTRIDRGDGTFIEQPRYCTRMRTESRTDSWCSYSYDQIMHVRDARAGGGPDQPLQWPNLSLGFRETEMNREQKLIVRFTGLGDKANQTYEYVVPNEEESTWRQFRPGQTYSVKFNRLEQAQWDSLSLTN